jgi:endonuclease YncB( thermonuclease family)
MRFWKKRDDGFEWHQYVRTTIKLRREARRDRAQQFGEQVAGGAKAAGVAADVIAKGSAHKLRNAIQIGGTGLRSLMARLSLHAAAGFARLRGLGAPALDVLGRSSVSGPLFLAGSIALVAGALRVALAAGSIDGESIAALAIGAVCLALSLGPALALGHGILHRPAIAPIVDLPSRWRLAGVGAVLLLLAGGIAVMAGRWTLPGVSLASLSGLPLIGANVEVKGKATVIGNDALRIGNTVVRLTGIEALDADQRCPRANARAGRTWACGDDAREALGRLVRGRVIACEAGSADKLGVAWGRCRDGTKDLAQELVRAGFAFAEIGLVSPYKTAQAEAQAAKAGIWSVPTAERPQDWRSRVWAEAKGRAPEGCPIKGAVKGGDRIYVLPWATEYSRIRVSARRGERWFCSEADAVAAGFRSAARG